MPTPDFLYTNELNQKLCSYCDKPVTGKGNAALKHLDKCSAVKKEIKPLASSPGVSEYEKLRQQKMQRNAQMMQELGLKQLTDEITQERTEEKEKTKQVRAARRRKKEQVPPAEPRRSKRLRGLPNENIQIEHERLNSITVSRYDHVKEEVEPLPDSITAEGLHWLKKPKREPEEEDMPVSNAGEEYSLAEKDIVKATPQRIYSLQFQPTRHKLVYAAGDRKGNVALCSGDGDVNVFRPHLLPVPSLCFDPSDPSQLITCSYDGTLRNVDLMASKLNFNTIHTIEDNIPAHWVIPDVQSTSGYWISCADGFLEHLDMRSAATEVYCCHEKKINTVEQDPKNPFCLVTASLDRTVSVWDIRKLKTSGSHAATKLAEPVSTLEHRLSVNSATFSPSGKVVATVCQDDYIHLYDGASMQHIKKIAHNNDTGRWISKFMAIWDPKKHKDERFIIGSKRQPRCLEIISVGTSKPPVDLTVHRLENEDLFCSIHSVNAFHPYHNVIIASNSSGRTALWRQSNS